MAKLPFAIATAQRLSRARRTQNSEAPEGVGHAAVLLWDVVAVDV